MRVLFLVLFAFACGGHSHEGFETYQACFDEHTTHENLPVQQAIVVCCLDHPIHGVSTVCGNTAAECETYLTTNLSAASASGTDRTTACAEYITQKGM